MPIQQTGWSGEVVVPCSHCNSNDNGPEAGICHRGLDGRRGCKDCLRAHTKKSDEKGGIIKALILVAGGYLERIPCSHCKAIGYRKV